MLPYPARRAKAPRPAGPACGDRVFPVGIATDELGGFAFQYRPCWGVAWEGEVMERVTYETELAAGWIILAVVLGAMALII